MPEDVGQGRELQTARNDGRGNGVGRSRALAVTGSRVDRTEVIEGRLWFY